MSATSRFLEALALLEVANFYEQEIPRRRSTLAPGPGRPNIRAVNEIKIDFIAAAVGASRGSILQLRRDNPVDFVSICMIEHIFNRAN